MNADEANALRFTGKEDNHYDLYFVTFNDLESETGYWIRYTLYAPLRRLDRTYVEAWFTFFDRRAPEANFGLYERFPLGALEHAAAPFRLAIGPNELTNGVCRGRREGSGHKARWDLRFEPQQVPFLHFPVSVYTTGQVVAALLMTHYDTRFSGTIDVDGRRIELKGAPGEQGHTWGPKHAHHWLWAHCTHFEDSGAPAGLELLSVPAKKDATSKEPAHFVSVQLDGREHRLMSVFDRSKIVNDWRPGLWRIEAEGETLRVVAEVRARLEDLAEGKYTDPDGEEFYCVACEVADLDARVYLRENSGAEWRPARELRSRGTTHAEWGDWFPHPEVATKIIQIGEEP